MNFATLKNVQGDRAAVDVCVECIVMFHVLRMSA